MIRIVAVSDLHGHLPEIPGCDLLLLAGDLCPAVDHAPEYQAGWLDTAFRGWLDRVPARHVVGVAGNHDGVFERSPEQVPAGLRWTYLQDAAAEVCGLRVYGTPWQPWFHDWAFNAPRRDGETFLAERFAAVPADTDVLVSHGPPLGYGDRTERGDDAGSAELLRAIDRVRPRLAVFGHIHEGRGRWLRYPTVLANVSLVDERYRPVHNPAVFELPGGATW